MPLSAGIGHLHINPPSLDEGPLEDVLLDMLLDVLLDVLLDGLLEELEILLEELDMLLEELDELLELETTQQQCIGGIIRSTCLMRPKLHRGSRALLSTLPIPKR